MGPKEKLSNTAKRRTPRAKRPYFALIAFAVCALLTVLTVVNNYLTKVPGFWVAVEAIKGFSQAHFGFFVFLVSLFGMVLAWAFSEVPELPFAGFKVKNPLHNAASNQESEALRDNLRTEVAELKQQLRSSRAERETAATNVDIYEFALKTCSHQDSVLEKLFIAFDADDTQFEAVYHQTMNWLAHVAKQLVVRQHRTLNCTIMRYDSAADQCRIIGEVGTSPIRASRFHPSKGLGIGGAVIATGEPILSGNVLKDPRYQPSSKDDPRSLMCIPIFSEGKVVGLVNVRCRPENAFCETDLKTVQPAIDNIAIAMALAKLRSVQRRQPALTRKLDEYLQGSTATGGDHHDVNQKDGAGSR